MANRSELLQSLRIERGEGEPETAKSGKRWAAAGSALAVAFALGGATGWLVKPAPRAAISAPLLDAAASAPARPSGALVASGYVVARRAATVAAEVTGKLVEIRVEEGQRVRAGEIIAILEPTLARAARDSASARSLAAVADAAEAERILSRTAALAQEGFASNAALTAAQARVDAARAQARATRSEAARAGAELARYQIRAPFSGVITNKAAQAGEIISPVSAGGGFTRTGICTIVDMESLEIEVDVSESLIAGLREGRRASAVLDAYPGVEFPAHVIAVIPAANRERATFRVRVAFDALDPRILPEMATTVTFAPLEEGERHG